MNIIAKLCLAVICLITCTASAQYRMVNGIVYRLTDPRTPFTSFSCPMRVIGILASGELRLQECFYYSETTAQPIARTSIRSTRTRCTFGREIILKNYPLSAQFNVGDEITGGIIAMRVAGTFTTGSRSVGSSSFADNKGYAAQSSSSYGSETDGVYYDYGTDYQLPARILTPAERAAAAKKKTEQAAKTFRWLYAQATNGSVSAQCSLGEYYLNGKGTETNLVEATKWLNRSAMSGDAHASNVLASISATNSTVNSAEQ